KRVLITGVSSGIGLVQAQLFLENNYQVYGVDQGENPLLQGDFHFLQRDLTLDLEPIFDWCPQVQSPLWDGPEQSHSSRGKPET
ncbi:MAG: hypothetical protein ACFN0W_07530, partial [Propionibacterium acidifaciens]|uniref:hypothetical protein n=1 Tax=Propionibacterium acidifaciens TaxID=556499 RepID=UPI003613C647